MVRQSNQHFNNPEGSSPAAPPARLHQRGEMASNRRHPSVRLQINLEAGHDHGLRKNRRGIGSLRPTDPEGRVQHQMARLSKQGGTRDEWGTDRLLVKV